MCIICNLFVHPGDEAPAEEFLAAFEQSRQQMRRAADAMLVCSKKAVDADVRKRYDAVHKEMTRQLREWNKLEQKREHDPATDNQN